MPSEIPDFGDLLRELDEIIPPKGEKMKQKTVDTENIIVAPVIGGYEIMFKKHDGWYVVLLKGSDATLFEALWWLVKRVFPNRTDEELAFYTLSFGYSAKSERIM